MQERDRVEQESDEQRLQASERDAKGNRAEIGQPGIESASGRDRSKGELAPSFGTNEGTIDLSSVAPPPGAVEGTRVGEQGDPTGVEETDESAKADRP